MKVPVYNPLIESDDILAVKDVLEERWLGQGKHVKEFENKIADILENPERKVVAVSNGTVGIHLALLIAGVGAGDEVIVTSLNFVGVCQAILAVGAEPVFCDVNPESLVAGVQEIKDVFTDKTAAIVPLDYASNLCELEEILLFSKLHGLRVIHDAAHSFGWRNKGRITGSFGDITVFSFDPVKNFTAIDAGVVVVNTVAEERWLIEARAVGQEIDLSNSDKNAKMEFREVAHIGFRYHLSNVHAALAVSQLSKFGKISQSRRESCEIYNHAFSKYSHLILPITENYKDIIPFIYVVRVKNNKRDFLREYLTKNGIETHVHWKPVHEYKLFRNHRANKSLDVTEKAGKEVLTLPLHSCMNEDAREAVIKCVEEFFSEH